jgi:hypothetical protein
MKKDILKMFVDYCVHCDETLGPSIGKISVCRWIDRRSEGGFKIGIQYPMKAHWEDAFT